MKLITTDSDDTFQSVSSTTVTLSLDQASLSGASLRGVDLKGASFKKADLSKANLDGADLRSADLTDADLSKAALKDADLRDANLSGVNLSDLGSYKKDGSKIFYGYAPGRIPRNLGADLSGADLRGAELKNSNLKDVVLENADLRGVSIEEGNLSLSWLCHTKLPEDINIDSNRDCSQLEALKIEQSYEKAAEMWQDEEFKQRLDEFFSDQETTEFLEEDR